MSNEMNTPWIAGDHRAKYTFVNDAKGVQMCIVENSVAAHIVKCVNSHDLLISALTSARNRLADMLMNGGDDGQAWKEARKSMPLIETALAAAQGRKHEN